ncbi:hypothetical protein T06_2050 [Trichinella sp. T6]|nr:hypothetical protein T06_2050 [Trichinella sp. T6]
MKQRKALSGINDRGSSWFCEGLMPHCREILEQVCVRGNWERG